jgi:hypothetical protein
LQALPENLSLVVCLNSETLLGIEASTQTLLQLAQEQVTVKIIYTGCDETGHG